MKYLFILMVQIAVCIPALALREINYRKEGRYMIGAIIPLTQDSSSGNCSKINPKGVTIAEALVYAFDQIERESAFIELRKRTSLGYDIRDNCGNPESTTVHAYNITTAALQYQLGQSKTVPDKVVISEFTNKDMASISNLMHRNISQVSYSADNARLKKSLEKDAEYPIKTLISVYPEYTKKIVAVGDIVKEYQFKYIFAIANNNMEGAKAMSDLSSKLGAKICMTKLLVSSVGEVKGLVSKIAENPKIKVVVVHCTKDIELEFYKEFGSRNMTDLIIITTQNWKLDTGKLKPYMDVVDGMLDIYYRRGSNSFKRYLRERDLPFKGRKWLGSLFLGVGGEKSCLTIAGSIEKACIPYRDKVRDLLEQNAPAAEYAYQAVLAIAFALQESALDIKNPLNPQLQSAQTLLKALSGLHINLEILSGDPLVFNSNGTAERSKFGINNFRVNDKKELNMKWLGVWDENNQIWPSPLNFRKDDVRWKGGSKETPVSVCSDSCPPGYERSFLDETKCCWECSRCPNDTASNISNADKCLTCPEGTVVQPNQAGCKTYKLLYFQWFGGVGALIIILMVIGVCLILFALGVFSQNSDHELVINSNYNSLCLFLFACLILIFTPIPLLINTPTETSCFAYIIMFNIGISLVIGILTSRSAYINGLFDDNGELTKGTFGRFPRTVVVLLVVVLQIVVTIAAYKMEMLETLHNHTYQWDERYHECSSWASCTFWAGFTFNIVASVFGNSMSCTSVKMPDNCFELKYVLISHLMFYMFGIVELVIFFGTNDQHLAGGQAVNCILFAFAFYFSYVWPKLFAILFRSKGNKVLQVESDGEEEGSLMTTAIHASAGFKHQGIVQMKVRDED